MEDYYIDEIPIIMEKYAELNKIENEGDKEVTAEDF